MAKSMKAMDDALRRLSKVSNRTGLLGRKSVLLTSQLNKLERARDAAASGSND